MAQNLTTAVIRGRTYDKWDAFWCQATAIGNSNSMGTGYEIATLKIGDEKVALCDIIATEDVERMNLTTMFGKMLKMWLCMKVD